MYRRFAFACLLLACSACTKTDDRVAAPDSRIEKAERDRTAAKLRADLLAIQQANAKRPTQATTTARQRLAPPVKPAPVADAAERRRIERDFELLPAHVQREIETVRDIFRTGGAKSVAARIVAQPALTDNPIFYRFRETGFITLYRSHFPQITTDDIRIIALAVADGRGVKQHLDSLNLNDPEKEMSVRIAFGSGTFADAQSAKIFSNAIARGGLVAAGETGKAFIRSHPDLFPEP